jgi:hypothetical protein
LSLRWALRTYEEMIRFLLNIILILTVFLSCFLEEALLSFRPPRRESDHGSP